MLWDDSTAASGGTVVGNGPIYTVFASHSYASAGSDALQVLVAQLKGLAAALATALVAPNWKDTKYKLTLDVGLKGRLNDVLPGNTPTFASPIKNITTQILARTTPTLLDLVIALVAGAIGALGITQKKISESLAGVAIATSLMPPLCVSGIGLTLFDYQTFTGGFLLFFTNAVAIIFVAVLVFSFVGVRGRTNSTIRRKGAYILVGIIIITAIPLYFYLRTYSFELSAYQETKDVLQRSFEQISPSIIVTNITTDFSSSNNDSLSVDAQILLPEDISIDYTEQQKIAGALENTLHKKISLQLTIQRTISVLTEKDVHYTDTKQKIQNIFSDDIAKINPLLSIASLLVDKKGKVWNINAVLRGDPSIVLTEKDRITIQKHIISSIHEQASLNLQIIPLTELLSIESIDNKKIAAEVQTYLSNTVDSNSLLSSNIAIVKNDDKTKQLEISIELKVLVGYQLPDDLFAALKEKLETEYKKTCTIQVNVIEERRKVF